MWDEWIQLTEEHPILRFAGGGNKSRRSRLQRFCKWQQASDYVWYRPAMAAWRDHLLEKGKLKTNTTRVCLSTVRAAYGQLLRSNDFRRWLFNQMPPDAPPERRIAWMGEFEARLKNEIDPKNSPVSVVKIQDKAHTNALWLTPEQAAELVLAPDVDTLKGLRDTAMIALMLCTGIRSAELLALDVNDLESQLGSERALHIKSGKGTKQRLIPYGKLDWGLKLTQQWLKCADIVDGSIFVALRKGDRFYLDKKGYIVRLSKRSLEYTLNSYPITINGIMRRLKPLDLRRTYARQLYLTGMDLTAIQQNMGHKRQDVTLGYIGLLDGHLREAGDAYGIPKWFSGAL